MPANKTNITFTWSKEFYFALPVNNQSETSVTDIANAIRPNGEMVVRIPASVMMYFTSRDDIKSWAFINRSFSANHTSSSI
jgi:hypothetical protein